MARKGNLHWCRGDQVDAIIRGGGYFIDGKSVQQDKKVQMFAEMKEAQYDPREFTIRMESFVLTKLIRRIGGRWHPIDPFPAKKWTDLKFFAENGWDAGTNNVTKQTNYFFSDVLGDTSGVLTVTQATHYVRQKGADVNGHAVVKLPGTPAEIGIAGGAKDSSIIEGIGASKDPELRVQIMVPGGPGDTDLLDHVRRLLSQEADLKVPSLTTGTLLEASEGYLEPGASHWLPTFEDGKPETTVSVDEGKDVEVRISLESALESAEPFRTAYALRVSDWSDPSNYVIGDIVEVERTADLLRIRS